ncbi:MAG TPA: transposase, partial [Chlamydiales bacterium]|nr:transposase [Chlamydiales bacterium]
EPLFPVPVKRTRGKPHTPWRSVMNSILYVLTTGAKWEALPKRPEFSSKSAAHRWYKVWKASGFLDQIMGKLNDLSLMASGLVFPPSRQRAAKQHQPIAAE